MKLSEGSAELINSIVRRGINDLYGRYEKPLCARFTCVHTVYRDTKFCVGHQKGDKRKSFVRKDE